MTNPSNTLAGARNSIECPIAEIKVSTSNKWPLIGHRHYYGPAIAWIANQEPGAKWQRSMSSRKAIGIKAATIGSLQAMIAIANAIK
jgi:hypothetical protein